MFQKNHWIIKKEGDYLHRVNRTVAWVDDISIFYYEEVRWKIPKLTLPNL